MFRNNSIILFLVIMCSLFVFNPEGRWNYLLITWTGIITYTLMDISRRILLSSFLISIFVFLLTRLFIPKIYLNSYIDESLNNTLQFKQETYDFIYTAIFISLVAVTLGFLVGEKNVSYNTTNINYNSYRITKIRKIAKILTYFTFAFCIIEILEKVIFVWGHSYLDFYLYYRRRLPAIIYILSTSYDIVFFLFLATLPTRKEAKSLIILFLFSRVLSLFTGGRADFVNGLIFIVAYAFLRNSLPPNEYWIRKKERIVLIITAPAICILMFIVMALRGGNETQDYSSIDLFVNFFFQQGSSIQVLGLSYEWQHSIPDRSFAIGPLWDQLQDNIIFKLLGINTHLYSQTQEMALHGHSLGNYLTYTFQTKRFLSGGGMGSSYIAEVWLDFGYIGIVLWSFMYGIILARIFSWCQKNIWLSAISFIVMTSIIYSPRAGAIDFIRNISSPTYCLILFIIYYTTRNISTKTNPKVFR